MTARYVRLLSCVGMCGGQHAALALLLALLVLPLGDLHAQRMIISARDKHHTVVFDDSVQAVVTKRLTPPSGAGSRSGWHDLSAYQYYTAYVTFEPDGSSGFFAGGNSPGFATGDTVRVTYELYADPDTASVTSSTVGFIEHIEGARKVLFNFVVGDTTNPRRYISFHGPGDPELALTDFIAFYSTVVGTITSPGIGMRLTLKRQP